MVQRYLFAIGEVVMFVLSSNHSAIKRMKDRAGGYFKGTVVKETKNVMYIKPHNKGLLDRLKDTNFYCQGVVVGNRLLTESWLVKEYGVAPRSMVECDLHTIAANFKVNASKVQVVECLIIPKKQVEHWLGEKRRLNDALDALKQSSLVKKHTKSAKKLTDKHQEWVWTPEKRQFMDLDA